MKRIIAGLLAVVLLLAAACAPAPAPPAPSPPAPAPPAPVAPNVLKFVLGIDLSGPVSIGGSAYAEGVLDYVTYAKEKGLIPKGIEIEVSYEDSKYDLAREISIYKKCRVDPDVVTFSSFLTATGEALRDSYVEDKIMRLHVTSTSRHAAYPFSGYSFAVSALYNEENRALMHWLKENHWKEDRPAKVGILLWDFATGHAMAEGFEVGARENGWEVIGIEKYAYPTAPDMTPSLLKFKDAGVDYIACCFSATGVIAGVVLRDIEKVGLLGKVTPLINSTASDESLIRIAKEKTEGCIGATNRPQWDEVDVPGVKLLHEFRDKYRGGKDPGMPFMNLHAVANTMVALEAVRLACADIGAANVGRENLQKYLMQVKDFDTMGIIGKVTMEAGDPRLGKNGRVIQVKDGKWVVLQEWRPIPMWKASEWDWK